MFSASTPECGSSKIQRHYNPNLVKRMQRETCYTCKEKGHWSWDCPLNFNSLKANKSHSPLNIWCRCGHGFCEVKTVKNPKNFGKKYYSCPIKRGKQCAGIVKWCECDGGKIYESDLHPPPYKYPECECRAGVCEKVQVTESSGLVKYYFTCPIAERHGSCGYRVWEDELLKNETIVTIKQSSRQRTPNELLKDVQRDKTDSDLGEGDYLLVEHSKRTRAQEKSKTDSDNRKSMSVSEFPEKVDIVQSAAPSKGVCIPEFEFVDCLQDQELACYASINEDASLLSCQSTTSMICCQENMFERKIFAGAVAAASFGGHCPIGWLGRLLFFIPTQSLKLPQPQPFLCCIFPSFNPIIVPKQASIGNGRRVECTRLAISNLSQHVQLPSGCNMEVTPYKSPSSVRKPMSKEKKQRQIVLFAQQQLLIDLESLDPNEHESMKEAAEATFDVLDNLGVDYKQFHEHVCDYIDISSSIAETNKSMENSVSLNEYNKRVEDAKARFAHVRDDCFNAETLLGESNKLRQSLIEEISHLEAMLGDKQMQLKSCESENLKIETHLDDLRKFLVEADATLKITTEEAKVARQHNEERQAKQIAAKTALENAKLELVAI